MEKYPIRLIEVYAAGLALDYDFILRLEKTDAKMKMVQSGEMTMDQAFGPPINLHDLIDKYGIEEYRPIIHSDNIKDHNYRMKSGRPFITRKIERWK